MEVNERINIKLQDVDEEHMENLCNNVKNTHSKHDYEKLPGNQYTKRQVEWVTDENRELRIERAKYKNIIYEAYWELNKEISCREK